MRNCSIEGCESTVKGKRGMCNAHYLRWYRHGDPLAGGTSPGAARQWVLEHISHEGDGCLIWPFARGRDGRGRISTKEPQAHRLMCVLVNGPPPSHIHQAAHTCGNGHFGCVHPRHLKWATPVENMADCLEHGTRPRGERTGGSKLREADVREIRLLKGRLTQREIGDRFGVDKETIGDIHRGATWAWLV